MSKTYISLLSYFGYHVTSFMVGIKNSAKTTMIVPKLNELSYCYKTRVVAFHYYWQLNHHSSMFVMMSYSELCARHQR